MVNGTLPTAGVWRQTNGILRECGEKKMSSLKGKVRSLTSGSLVFGESFSQRQLLGLFVTYVDILTCRWTKFLPYL